MEFIEEEIDIKYEYDIYDLDRDHDLGSSSHSTDWKLIPDMECRDILERMKSLDSDKEVHGNPDEYYEAETETSSGENESVDVDKLSCGIYRKLKLSVDSLKNCEKRENCELCEEYIHQLQQHLLLTHGSNRGDFHEKNSIGNTLSVSEPVPVSLDRNHVPSEKKNLDVNISLDGVDKNSGDEVLSPLTIRFEGEGETTSRKVDPNNIIRKSILKGGKSKPYKCDFCPMTFLIFYDLTQHKTLHIEENRDSVRDTDTPLDQSHSYDLNRHKRVHTGEKPYKCDICGKFFTQICTLTEHKLTHTGEKPHKCEQCGKYFTCHSHLIRHTRIHTGEKPYRCELCGKCFAQNIHLTIHARAHKGEKPCRCEQCGKCFAQNSHLTVHARTHKGEKLYRCEQCGKCFAQNGHLAAHARTHTADKP